MSHKKTKEEFIAGEKGFNKLKYFDGLKDAWCVDNKIKLLRIPHTDGEDVWGSAILRTINAEEEIK